MNITLDRVSFKYPGLYNRSEPIRDLSWELEPGVTGLIGPNGGGKTTLIKLLTTLLKPSSGDILINGQSLLEKSVRKHLRNHLGLLPQEPRFVSSMTTQETVDYLAWIHQVPARERDKRVREALESVHLSDKKKTRVGHLSGGQKRRLAVACAVVHRPTVLILDEPTVGLDPNSRLEIRSLISQLSSNRTVLLSTHLVEDARYLCERIGILAEGRIVYRGTYAHLEEEIEYQDGEHTAGSDFELAYSSLIAKFTAQTGGVKGGQA